MDGKKCDDRGKERCFVFFYDSYCDAIFSFYDVKRLYYLSNPLENFILSEERGETICQKIEVDADAVSVLVMTAAG